eukprot:1195277-Prorocentrum_minimum.AAC.5
MFSSPCDWLPHQEHAYLPPVIGSLNSADVRAACEQRANSEGGQADLEGHFTQHHRSVLGQSLAPHQPEWREPIKGGKLDVGANQAELREPIRSLARGIGGKSCGLRHLESADQAG